MGKTKALIPPKLLLVGSHCALNQALQHRFVCADFDVRWLRTDGHRGQVWPFLLDLEVMLKREVPDFVIVSPSATMTRAERLRVPTQVLQAHLLAPTQAIQLALASKVRRLLFVGSHDIYPGGATVPNAEEDVRLPRDCRTGSELATGHLACLQMCAVFSEQYAEQGVDFRSLVLADVFGPGEPYEHSPTKVVYALIDRMHRAKRHGLDKVDIQGDGSQRRDWMFADDAAEAALQTLSLTRDSYHRLTLPGLRHLSAGSGQAMSLMELAGAIASTVGYHGHLITQAADHPGVAIGPDQKIDDARLRRTGWRPRVGLMDALRQTYDGYLKSKLATPAG